MRHCLLGAAQPTKTVGKISLNPLNTLEAKFSLRTSMGERMGGDQSCDDNDNDSDTDDTLDK